MSARRTHVDLTDTLHASTDDVERFCQHTRMLLVGTVPPDDAFAIELLLREALANAVAHGCGHDPSRTVRCDVRIDGDGATIAVADDGDGFEWRADGRRGRSARAPDGRGLAIMRRYATTVEFNEQGNAVMLTRVFGARRT